MDANCLPNDPAAGVDPAPTAAGGDWRGQLQPRGRSRVVNIITEAMKKHLRVSKPEELNQLQEIAAGFEKRVYTAAINQSDYLRKLSLKLLSMEMKTQQAPSTKKKRKTQQAPRNAQVIPDQNNSRNMESPIWTMYGPIGWDPTAGLPLTCDWRAQLQPEDRSRIVDMIMETLKTHLLSSAPEDLNQLREIIERYEKRIYTEATNQSDYMPKISLKMLSMEKTQQATKNAHVISDQNNCNKPHTQASQKRARLN